jgi:hypothetical protein
MPLLPGSDKGIVGSNIAELRRSGYKEDQAVAIAMKHAGKSKPKPAKAKPKPCGCMDEGE